MVGSEIHWEQVRNSLIHHDQLRGESNSVVNYRYALEGLQGPDIQL